MVVNPKLYLRFKLSFKLGKPMEMLKTRLMSC